MGEIVDFYTGETITIPRIKKSKPSMEIIESLYQRRNQVGEIILIYYDKVHGKPWFAMHCPDENDRMALERKLMKWLDDTYEDYEEPV